LLLAPASSTPSRALEVAALPADPTGGVLEARLYMHSRINGHRAASLAWREWVDAAHSRRRLQMSFGDPPSADAWAVASEDLTRAGVYEHWTSGPEGGVVTRSYGRPIPVFGVEASLARKASLEDYRRLYRNGRLRLVGRVRWRGRSLLELAPRRQSRSTREQIRGHELVLVDPRTLLPLLWRETFPHTLAAGMIVETEALSYREIPGPRAGPRLFDLAALHPAATLTVLHGRGAAQRRAGRL
jgi:hypothetical protein